MRLANFGYTLGLSAAVAMLFGCGGSQTATGLPARTTQASVIAPGLAVAPHIPSAKSLQVLRRFDFTDGGAPYSGLIQVNRTLYGTTSLGGRYGCGIVYSISATGAEKVLYSFRGYSDGAFPQAGLISVDGILYGTTPAGGGSGCAGYGCGTVYRVSTTGSEKILHSFGGGSDGALPSAGLTDVKGTLYGTTAAGGGSGCTLGYGCGTVYRISTTGSEKVIYSFSSRADGSDPEASLLEVNGALYGTTVSGGSSNLGTVFRLSTTGAEKVLHSFGSGSDGADPTAGLININGTLYGTTSEGGGSSYDGTVYSISTAGVEKVLHSFTGGADGVGPYAGLINVNGTLYGTTYQGGPGRRGFHGLGTIYSISTTGSEKVLYSFADARDGAYVYAGLLNVKHTLYGTTYTGGITYKCHTSSCGIVFAFPR